MVNAVRKAAQELDGVNALPVEVARVEGEADCFAAVDGLEGHLSAVEVESNLAGMDLEGKLDATVPANIEDGIPLAGKILQAGGHYGRGGRRIAGHVGPEPRPGEAAQHHVAQLFG